MKQLKEIRTQLAIQHDDLLDQYCELEEKLKDKSTAETRTKRIEDKVSRKIELEKLNNRMKLLSRVIDAYDTKISFANFNINTPSTDLAISTIETNNKELLALLNKEYVKLDILSTKKVLASEFKRERLKGINKYDFGPFPFAGGLLSSVFIGIPFQNIVNLPFSVSNLLLGLGIPFVAGFGATSYGIVKSTKQKKEAFSNLNDNLGEEKLVDEISLDYNTYKESNEINQLIDSKIQELMIILMNQKENEKMLEYSKKHIEELEKDNEHIRYFTNVEKTNHTGFDTVIANSGRWAGYEIPQARYAYSSPANYKSTRTERDETKKTGDLYTDLIDEIEIVQEQRTPVPTKKLTPSKNTSNE